MGTIVIIGDNAALEVRKILCIGRNYRAHAVEMEAEIPTEPVIFLKPSSSIAHSGENLILPRISQEMQHEVELVVAMGKPGKNIPESDARDFILGYGVGLDMTLRDLQKAAKRGGLPWTISKGFDTAAPVSDFIAAKNLPDDTVFNLRCTVNGGLRQSGDSSSMMFPVPYLIHYLSTIFSLERGDLLFTGTPEGVGTVSAGDQIVAELAGGGRRLSTRHRVIAE